MVNIHTFLQEQCCNDNCNKSVITDIHTRPVGMFGCSSIN